MRALGVRSGVRLACTVLALATFACQGQAPVPPDEVAFADDTGGEAPAGDRGCAAPESELSEAAIRERLARLPGCFPLRLALVTRLRERGACDAAREEQSHLPGDLAEAGTRERARSARIEGVLLAASRCGTSADRRLARVHCEELLAEPAAPESAAAAWLACGRLDEARGETAQAMQRYRRARELAPEASDEAARAIEAPAALALRFRDFSTAARLFADYTEVRPRAPDGWRGLALARRGLGDLEGAIRAMERAAALGLPRSEAEPTLERWRRERADGAQSTGAI